MPDPARLGPRARYPSGTRRPVSIAWLPTAGGRFHAPQEVALTGSAPEGTYGSGTKEPPMRRVVSLLLAFALLWLPIVASAATAHGRHSAAANVDSLKLDRPVDEASPCPHAARATPTATAGHQGGLPTAGHDHHAVSDMGHGPHSARHETGNDAPCPYCGVAGCSCAGLCATACHGVLLGESAVVAEFHATSQVLRPATADALTSWLTRPRPPPPRA